MAVQREADLAPLTTFGLPARAERLAACTSVEDIRMALTAAGEKGLPLTILGGGSNVLLTGDVPGMVLHNRIAGMDLVREDGDDVWVRVGAGVSWHGFVKDSLARGWYGLENLSLIPGSVGASPMQNIGAYGIEVEARFHSLEAIATDTGEARTFGHAECEFGYRESVFKRALKGAYVITHVTYRLSRKPDLRLEYGAIRSELEAMGIQDPTPLDVSAAVIRIRQSKLPDPAEIGNAGSFFKNPVLNLAAFSALQAAYPDVPNYPAPGGVKVAAGWLIDRGGWKGHTRGTHGVHDRQALVLVHQGGATGAEVLKLARDIQADVREKFGVDLELEVNVLPI
ncbi:MAG: UDP-N-acetylenolpyruvoylglucosamine reductase [Flavobacteriales bacterium]|nr:UDP-N-acetylenolpyruvoylglucosamine reductase [Flavobacteriales bacterium]